MAGRRAGRLRPVARQPARGRSRLGRRRGQPRLARPAGRGIRHRLDRGGTGDRTRRTPPCRPAPAPGRRAGRAGRRRGRAGRVRVPAAPRGHRRTRRRQLPRGRRRGRPGPRPGRAAGRPAQRGRLRHRPHPPGRRKPAGVDRLPIRGPAARLGWRGPVGQPQPGPQDARGGRGRRDAAAVGRGLAPGTRGRPALPSTRPATARCTRPRSAPTGRSWPRRAPDGPSNCGR